MSSAAVKVRMHRTSIGGRWLMLRFGRVVIQCGFVWGLPWGQYIEPMFIRLSRMAFGYRFVLRIGKPYLKIDIELLPKSNFHGGAR